MSLEDRKQKLIHTEEEAKELVGDLQKCMQSDEEYSLKEFDKRFKERRAEVPLSMYGFVGVGNFVSQRVTYDINRQIDVRPLINCIGNKNDKNLMRDVCVHVGERFVNCEPDTELTLKQFCTILTSRLIAVGF